MTFQEAMQQAKPGDRIRRDSWEIYVELTISEYDQSVDFNNFNLYVKDFKANDWVVAVMPDDLSKEK
jgi:hypothetical protein